MKAAEPHLSDDEVAEVLDRARRRLAELTTQGLTLDESLEATVRELFEPVPDLPRSASPVPPALTARQIAGIEFTIEALVTELKRRRSDRANTGIQSAEFLSVWNRVRVTDPIPACSRRRVSDAAHARIDAEMDAAFQANVAKSRADREARNAQRRGVHCETFESSKVEKNTRNGPDGTQNVVSWSAVLPMAKEAFHIWTGQPELGWAAQAWNHLTDAGLAERRDALGHVRAYVRLLVLASIYRDWCSIVWDEMEDDSPEVWLSPMQVNPINIGQVLGPEEDVDDDLNEALNILIARERPVVVQALLRGFGGVPGLFVALWRSNKDPQEAGAGEEDVWTDPPETEADILNDVTPEKMAGYEWISDRGCETRGPVRSTAEMDD